MRTLLALLLVVAGTSGTVSTTRAIGTEALLDTLQHTAFDYFWNQANASNGLIKDRSASGAPASIAAVGFGLSAICIGVDHGWVTREAGRDRVLTTLKTFWRQPQGTAASGTIGYQGLFYHFLDMNTATRTWDSELSSIDTALLLAGVLDARQYFSTSDSLEGHVRLLADSIYKRVNWTFMRNFNPGIMMGWKPGTGFSGYGWWVGYNEAMIMYILALGSPTFPAPTSVWNTWTSGYQWQTHYGYSYVIFPPLFGHQYSHCWIDFRNIADAYMQGRGITYFENSRRATLAQRAYSIDNPGGFAGYGDSLWGLTASDGPEGYNARGAPPAQNDNGTIAPTAPVSSIPFAPEECIAVARNLFDQYGPQLWTIYGFRDAFNLSVNPIWWGPDVIGIDQGPMILMIENYRNGAVWNRFMQCPEIQLGLQRAGFISTVAVDPAAQPVTFSLDQNEPNPFRGTTTIRYQLARPGNVRLTVHDVGGREVVRLVDGPTTEGAHAAVLRAGDLPAGVYLYRLDVDGRVLPKKCVLVR